MAVAFAGCQSMRQERSTELVVKEQSAEVKAQTDEDTTSMATFTVDVPISGPQALMDTLMAFVNRELRDACESCAHFDDNVVTFRPEDVYTDDGEKLLSRYMEKYAPIIRDSLWKSAFGLTMKMEAQTDSFVTYGIESFHCGASCGSEKYYFTFDKRDGHQVRDIISHDNLVRFFEDYPEYRTIENYDWQYDPENEFEDYFYGLLNDHFSLVVLGHYNHFFTLNLPYSQIFSYLSPEVQKMVEQKGEEGTPIPSYLPDRSDDSQVWMEVDTVNCALIGYLEAAGGPLVDTLMHYEPELKIYPKQVYSVDVTDGCSAYLFIYSRGHLMYCDEALVCTVKEMGLEPAAAFVIDGRRDSVVSCMWHDQLVEASNGFPFEEFDENRFGIHYDWYAKRLYIPIMEHHEKGSEFENCLRYTARYNMLQSNGKDFVPAGTDGAWWLNPNLRDYQRTVSNRKTAEGFEQIDLMPDGTFRRAIWKGAKTLDDLRKKPDEVKISNNIDF